MGRNGRNLGGNGNGGREWEVPQRPWGYCYGENGRRWEQTTPVMGQQGQQTLQAVACGGGGSYEEGGSVAERP